MSRIAVVLAGLALWLAPTPARALFHIAQIDEVMSGVGGDPSVQYVEIRMLAPTQNFVKNSRLTFFSCSSGNPSTVLLLVPDDVTTSGADVRWLMGTPNLEATICVKPEFTFAAGIDVSCGQICWGAPGLIVPAPGSWDPTMPNNYVDCVSWGGYAGPTRTIGLPSTSASPAGDGTQSLTRTGAATFALATASAENNAGAICSCGPCPATTTTVSTTTTTTTLPAGTNLIPGTIGLVKPASLLKGVYKGTFPVPTSAGGAFLTVSDTGATAGSVSTSLPSGAWKGLGSPAGSKGWKYKGAGSPTDPCKIVLIKSTVIKHVCKGTGVTLTPPFQGDMGVVLNVGDQRYCARFGGTTIKNDPTQLKRKDAPAPSACP